MCSVKNGARSFSENLRASRALSIYLSQESVLFAFFDRSIIVVTVQTITVPSRRGFCSVLQSPNQSPPGQSYV